MPYVSEQRPYDKQHRYGVNHNLFPEYSLRRVDIETIHDPSPIGLHSGYSEYTWGYRSTRESFQTQSVMTGLDIRNAIYHGDALDIDPRAPGGVSLAGDPPLLYDNGHEFRSLKAWRTFHTFVDMSSPGKFYEYRGPLGIAPYSGSVDLKNPLDTDVLAKARLYALGNRAISQSAPTAPEANLATFVGELTRLPTMPGLQLLKGLNPRNMGREYLNMQFGWRPMVRDIQAMARAVTESQKIVARYAKQSGSVVRRRRFLVREEKTSQATENYRWEVWIPRYNGVPCINDFILQPVIRGVSLFQTEESVWFSGAFSYFLQETDTLLGRLRSYEQLANKLLGTRLDADAVWELTPWSWLIDWFVDLQSFITRASRLANDSLVLRHGYVMRSYRTSVTAMLPNVTLRNGATIATPQCSFSSIKLERWRSTPYGFALDVNALSPQRWAILAALGMTKSPGSLRTS